MGGNWEGGWERGGWVGAIGGEDRGGDERWWIDCIIDRKHVTKHRRTEQNNRIDRIK